MNIEIGEPVNILRFAVWDESIEVVPVKISYTTGQYVTDQTTSLGQIVPKHCEVEFLALQRRTV